MCFVPPDRGYLEYPDYRVLALLFGLMLVVAGLQGIGLFRYLGSRFLERIRDTRQLGFLLMSRLIYCLQKTQIRRLLLHVSGSNVPAVALYKKTGFGITETLSYYMY